MPSIARSSLTLFGSRAAGVLIGFLAVVVFAREIGVAALGSYFLFQALLTVLSIGTDFGLRSATEKRISEGRPAGEVLGTAIALKLGFVSLGAVAMLALRDPIAAYVGADLAPLIVAGAVLREAGVLTTFVLRGELRVTASATVEFARKVAFGVVGILLVLQGFGLRGPVYGVIAGYGAMALVGAVRVDSRPGRPTARMARSLLSFGSYRFVTNVGGIGYSWIDVLVIGAFLSPAAVGAYEVAWKVAGVATMFGDALATAAFPRLSEFSGRRAIDRVEETFPKLVTPTLALVVPAFFGTVVLASEILDVVFGPAYVIAATALVVLMADAVAKGFYQPVARTLRALDRPDIDAKAAVLQLALNAALNLLLVPRYGLVGAAVATVAAGLASKAFATAGLARLITVRVQWRQLAWCVVAAVVMAAVVGVSSRALDVNTAVELAAMVALGVGVYAGVALAEPTLRGLAVEGASAVRSGR